MSGEVETRAELVASRARILAGADESRRRLQREIHDGPQQRLVHAVIALRLAVGAAVVDRSTAELLAEALVNVEQASRGLRRVVHGILPRSLLHGGLGTALPSLVADLDLPVELRVGTPRLGPDDETCAYLAVAETLGEILEWVGLTRVAVDVDLVGGSVAIEVRHDGATPADAGAGGGLVGVRDRVLAAGGALTIARPADGERTVRLLLPVGLEVGAGERPETRDG